MWGNKQRIIDWQAITIEAQEAIIESMKDRIEHEQAAADLRIRLDRAERSMQELVVKVPDKS